MAGSAQDRKALRESYKEREIIGGVGVVKNSRTGIMLIESAPEISAKKNRFLLAKASGNCLYPKLQADWDKYGPSAFSYEVLEQVGKPKEQSMKQFTEDMLILEEEWKEKLGSSRLY